MCFPIKQGNTQLRNYVKVPPLSLACSVHIFFLKIGHDCLINRIICFIQNRLLSACTHEHRIELSRRNNVMRYVYYSQSLNSVLLGWIEKWNIGVALQRQWIESTLGFCLDFEKPTDGYLLKWSTYYLKPTSHREPVFSAIGISICHLSSINPQHFDKIRSIWHIGIICHISSLKVSRSLPISMVFIEKFTERWLKAKWIFLKEKNRICEREPNG